MVKNEPVSAYAVYRNLVHVGDKKVGKLKKKKKTNQKKKPAVDPNAPRSRAPCKAYIELIKSLQNDCDESQCVTKASNKKLMTDKLQNGKPAVVQSVGIKKAKNRNKVKCKTKKVNPPSKKVTQTNGPGKCERLTRSSNVFSGQMESDTILKQNNSGNSFADAQKAFSWLIHPVTPEEFFNTAWEKRPLHIKRHISHYYSSLLSTKEIDLMLREHNIQYTKNLDITSYVDGKRETHNPLGRAYPSVVWDYYSNGCSIRLLNPQTFIGKIWRLNADLQDMFGCFVGANVYLTPPDSQGFAPHYDDIEAFILQVEGKKHWKLYAPLSPKECLPRFSSKNFTQEEIGEPILDVVLEPGDMLYFPRGVIHQGSTLPDSHSLHITLSSYQRNTWGDLLEKLVPVALKLAIEENVEFREGLPTDYLRYMGVAHSDFTCEGRNKFITKVGDLMKRLFSYAPVDAAVDQLGKQLIHDALPPALSPDEMSCTVLNDGETMCNGVVSNRVEFDPDVRIKLLRGNVIRLVTEEDSIRAYHSLENSREYHYLDEPQFVELSFDVAPAVEFLLHSYPSYVSVDELPIDGQSEKIQLVSDLWEKGLIMTESPLDNISV